MKIKALLSLALLTTSLSSFAEQNNETHRVGLDISGGGASYKSSSKDGDGVGQAYLYYNYHFTPILALELGYNSGEDLDDWKCKDENDRKFTCTQNNKTLFGLGANNLEFDNFVVAAKGYYQISDNSYFYGKLGANYYDYEITRGRTKLITDDGIGFVAEAGWQYDWDNGMAVNLGYKYLDMGDLDTSSLSLGVSYRF
ncbi:MULTISPECIES: porin family protein [Pseudoalteromonas]|uniref:porin family protein n=1 Tax=Pseudoalteromonas TaxID=53246 RepID=UPI0002E3E586|nr:MULTISPECIES: porin family protein [Pseudoalteromonas]MDP4489731.1 porin family protein [Pseudoalteromonas piscicida]